MKTFRELILLLRVAQTHLCVHHNERDVERAKQRLALALEAKDKAVANLKVLEGEHNPDAIPQWLIKRVP